MEEWESSPIRKKGFNMVVVIKLLQCWGSKTSRSYLHQALTCKP